jgi:hypothetical protein
MPQTSPEQVTKRGANSQSARSDSTRPRVTNMSRPRVQLATSVSTNPIPNRRAGVSFLSASFFGLALVTAYSAYTFINASTGVQVVGVAATLIPSCLLATIAVGLFRQSASGWWCACAVSYFALIQTLGTLLIAAVYSGPVDVGVAVSVLVGSLLATSYLSRADVMNSFRFAKNAPSVLRSRVSPATAAFLLALLIMVVEIIGR